MRYFSVGKGVGGLFQIGIGYVDGGFQYGIGYMGGLFQCGKGCGWIQCRIGGVDWLF